MSAPRGPAAGRGRSGRARSAGAARRSAHDALPAKAGRAPRTGPPVRCAVATLPACSAHERERLFVELGGQNEQRLRACFLPRPQQAHAWPGTQSGGDVTSKPEIPGLDGHGHRRGHSFRSSHDSEARSPTPCRASVGRLPQWTYDSRLGRSRRTVGGCVIRRMPLPHHLDSEKPAGPPGVMRQGWPMRTGHPSPTAGARAGATARRRVR